jgi:hypothetical protein
MDIAGREFMQAAAQPGGNPRQQSGNWLIFGKTDGFSRYGGPQGS